jgi:DNA polymerase
MLRVCETYPGIVMHVHDEMIVEVPQGSAELALRAICEAMGKPIPWAPGLLLRGDGYLCDYYKKD